MFFGVTMKYALSVWHIYSESVSSY